MAPLQRMLTNRSIPSATVIPELAYPSVGNAVEWLCAAFSFTVRIRIADHRAQLNVGDGAIVVTELKNPGQSIDNAHSMMVRVEDIDSHFEQALKHGARLITAPTSYPYGERQYSVEDFAGHRWNFSQSIADVDPASWWHTGPHVSILRAFPIAFPAFREL